MIKDILVFKNVFAFRVCDFFERIDVQSVRVEYIYSCACELCVLMAFIT